MYPKYLWAVLRHKWFVMLECFKLGLIWRGIIHDWTKFLPDEFIPYARFFYGQDGQPKSVPPGSTDPIEAAFILAWNKHQKRHDHHWQFWLLTEDNPKGLWRLGGPQPGAPDTLYRDVDGQERAELVFAEWYEGETFKAELELEQSLLREPTPLPMSDKARREMLADWRGAGRAYGNADTHGWYLKRRHRMKAVLHPETYEWIEIQLLGG